MMFVALCVVGGLVGLVLLLAVVGFLLPEEFQARAELVIPRPIEDVWRVVADVETLSALCGGKLSPRGEGAWRIDLRCTALLVDTVEEVAPTRVVRDITDTVVPLTMRMTVSAREVAGGTEVVVVEEGRVRRGTWHVPFFRLMFRAGAASSCLRDYLRAVARAASAPELATAAERRLRSS